MKKYIVFLILSLISISLIAKQNTVRYPFVVYTEDTSLMLGGFNLVTWRDSSMTDNQAANLFIINLIYSFNKQFLGFTQLNYNIKNSNLTLEPFLKYEKWPSDYFETGIKSRYDSKEKILVEGINLKLNLKNKLRNNIFIIAGVNFINYSLRDFEENSFYTSNNITGIKGGLSTGLTFSIDYDSRNSNEYPTKGMHFSFENSLYDKAFYSDYNFSKHKISFKYFNDLGKDFILANQLSLNTIKGKAPFYQLNKLGENLRAYNDNRFNDNHLISFKTELRNFPFNSGFISRFGWVIFTEAGQVSDKLNGFTTGDFKYSTGAGIRFALVPSEKINLRLDFGFGGDGLAVGFMAREDF